MRWTIFFVILYTNSYGQAPEDEFVIIRAPEIIVLERQSRNSVIPVSVEVKGGYHIQANKVEDEFIIPSTLSFDGGREFVLSKLVFPNPAKFTLKGAGKTLDVYDGSFEIKAHFKKLKHLPSGIYPLKAKISYQACDSVRCLFPRTKEFVVNIEVQ